MKRLALTILLAGCAPDIRDAHEVSDGDDTGAGAGDSTGDTGLGTPDDSGQALDGSVHEEQVDASDSTRWVYYSFEAGTVSQHDVWTLSFQRYNVRLDGGSSGSGGVTAVVLAGADFDALTEPPTTGYVSDTDEALALGGWYHYDEATHVLTAADVVYVIREADGDHFKLQFLDYYDDAGNSGYPSFRWAWLGRSE